MKMLRQVIVFDASAAWRIGLRLAPDHVPLDWPDGAPQQVHLDLHVEPLTAHEEAISLGARLLLAAPGRIAPEGHQVYSDPAGHPFCIGWGHPSHDQLSSSVATHFGTAEAI